MRRNSWISGGTITAGAAAAGLALGTSHAPAATDFGPIIPDTAFVAVWVEDLPALQQSFEQSPYGQFWGDADVAPLRQWFNSQMEELAEAVEEDANVSLEELISAFSGGAAFYILAPADGTLDADTEPDPVFIVEVDEEGKEFFQTLLEGLPENLDWQDVRRESVEAAGLSGYRISGTGEDGEERHATYAFAEEHLILTFREDEGPLAVAADRVQNPRLDGAIGGREEIRRLGPDAISGPNRYSAYLDLGLILNNTLLGPGTDAQTRRAVENSGLADAEGLLFTGTAGAESTETDVLLLTGPQRRGLHEALYAAGPTPMDLVQNVSTDASSVTSFSLDLGRLYRAVMDIVSDVEPQAVAMVEMMILGQFAAYGVDPINDLLNNIRGEHVYVTRPLDPELAQQLPDDMMGMAAPQESQAFFLGLANGDDVVRTLKTLLDNLAQDPDMGQMFSYREEDGITFVDIQMPMDDGPIQPQLAFNNQAIVFANNAIEMREAVRTLKGEAADPLSESPGFRLALDDADRARTHVFTYTGQSAMETSVEQVRGFLLMGLVDEFLPGFEASMIPEPEVFTRYFGDSYGSSEFHDRMIRFRSTLRAAD